MDVILAPTPDPDEPLQPRRARWMSPQCGWGEEPWVGEGSCPVCLYVQAPGLSCLQGQPNGGKQGGRALRPALREACPSLAVGCAVPPRAHSATFTVFHHTHPHTHAETVTEASVFRNNSRVGMEVGLGPACLGLGSVSCDLGPWPCSMTLGLPVSNMRLVIVPTSWGDREGYCVQELEQCLLQSNTLINASFLNPHFADRKLQSESQHRVHD